MRTIVTQAPIDRRAPRTGTAAACVAGRMLGRVGPEVRS
jgi:hypothetical protein